MAEQNFGEETSFKRVTKVDEKPNEQALVKLAKAGDRSAFGKLVRLYQKRLFRFVSSLLGSFDQSEDIVQEAFIKAWQALDSFEPTKLFYPWLATIARNLAFNLMRKDKKQQSLEKITEAGFEPVSPDPGPLDLLLEGENEKRFQKALLAMPPDFRAVFVLRHFERMNYAEIAKELKIKPGTVDSRLYRARQFMVEQLGDLLDAGKK